MHLGPNPDYAQHLFRNRRRLPNGEEDPTFVLNRGPYRNAKILVCGANFGCGSSRESAVWTMIAFGIRCIVARSFADVYRENCLKNGLLPIVLEPQVREAFERAVLDTDGNEPFAVNLHTQQITGPDGKTYRFEIASAERTALLEGLDDIGLTLKHSADISAWERAVKSELPWLQELTPPLATIGRPASNHKGPQI